jgi:hypothetical protein
MIILVHAVSLIIMVQFGEILDICWLLSLLVRFCNSCNLKLTLAESMLKTYMFLCSGYLVHPKLLKLLLSSPHTWQDPVIVLTTKLIFPKQILCCELLLKILKIFCNSSVTYKIVYLLEVLNYISLFLYFSQGSLEMDFFRMLTDTIFRKSSKGKLQFCLFRYSPIY